MYLKWMKYDTGLVGFVLSFCIFLQLWNVHLTKNYINELYVFIRNFFRQFLFFAGRERKIAENQVLLYYTDSYSCLAWHFDSILRMSIRIKKNSILFAIYISIPFLWQRKKMAKTSVLLHYIDSLSDWVRKFWFHFFFHYRKFSFKRIILISIDNFFKHFLCCADWERKWIKEICGYSENIRGRQ